MMVTVGILILAASLANSQPVSSAGENKGNVRVKVIGFQNETGAAKIGLCDSSACFQNSEEKAIFNTTVNIASGRAEHVFTGVPYGTYAVTVYHDENANGKLDKGTFGKPLERYGFSNNARGVLSRPAYEKAAFELDRPEITISVTVK